MTSSLGTARTALVIVALLTACEVTRVTPDPDSSSGSAMDAAEPEHDAAADAAANDAASDAAATTDGAAGGSTFFPPLIPTQGSVCALAVAAECDGHEDCGEGQFCCGVFDPTRITYSSIGCADRCDADGNHIELCHPGEHCRVPSQVCRRSLLIGYEFISVCADPAAVPVSATGESVPGEIACGEQACSAGSEKCCLRARYDFFDVRAHELEPYCLPIDDDTCSCDSTPPTVPLPDSGVDAGQGPDEDAGAS